MVMNHQGYSAYPNYAAQRMREAMRDARIPYGPSAPPPDQGVFPNERARQYADYVPGQGRCDRQYQPLGAPT